MRRLLIILDKINEVTGSVVSWFSAILVFIICLDVTMRYLFDFTLIWIIELEIYFYALLFLLASGFALKHDRHVRVDVFYSRMSDKNKAWVDLIGTTIFLLPWCLIIIWVSANYSYFSFLILERSPQPGGLPALYLLKFSMTLGFILLALQGLSLWLRSFIKLTES